MLFATREFESAFADDRVVAGRQVFDEPGELRGARGAALECEAWVVKPGRQLSFTEAEVYAVAADGQRTLMVKTNGTMALTRAEASVPPTPA